MLAECIRIRTSGPAGGVTTPGGGGATARGWALASGGDHGATTAFVEAGTGSVCSSGSATKPNTAFDGVGPSAFSGPRQPGGAIAPPGFRLVACLGLPGYRLPHCERGESAEHAHDPRERPERGGCEFRQPEQSVERERTKAGKGERQRARGVEKRKLEAVRGREETFAPVYGDDGHQHRRDDECRAK